MTAETWCLTPAELGAAIARLSLAPTPASPLVAILPVAVDDTARPAPDAVRDVVFAGVLASVARPSMEIGVLRGPGQAHGPEWFYWGESVDAAFGHYWIEEDGRHCFTASDADALLASVRESLRLDVPVPAGALALPSSRVAFEALLGYMDLMRENELQSLLSRMPEPEFQATAQEVCDALGRSCATGDFRWLAALAQAITPFDFQLDDERCRQGLEELAGNGLVTNESGQFRPTPMLRSLVARLGAPIGYAALHARFCSDTAKPQQHVAAVRGLGALCVFEFDLGDEAGAIRWRNVTTEEASLLFLGCMEQWGRVRKAAAPPSTARAICPNPACAKPLKPGVRFCTACGARCAPD